MATSTLNNLIGLIDIKKKAMTQIAACLARNQVFPNTLLWGPGGLGKTTVVRAIANDLGYHFEELQGGMLTAARQITQRLLDGQAVAKARRQKMILFIDEVQRLDVPMQEALYYPMMEHRVMTATGSIAVEPFSTFAATTRPDKLDDPFKSRFGNIWELRPYSHHEMLQMVHNYFLRKGVDATYQAIHELSGRTLGNARKARQLADKVILYANGSPQVTAEHVLEVCQDEGIDKMGLEPSHRRYMKVLHGSDRDVSLRTLSGAMGLHSDVIANSVEPVLLRLGLIQLMPRGRSLTFKGEQHILAGQV